MRPSAGGGNSANALTLHQSNTDLGNACLASLGSGLVDNITIDGELRLKVKGADFGRRSERGWPSRRAMPSSRRPARRSVATPRRPCPCASICVRAAPRRPTATAASPRAAGAVNVADTDDVKVGGIFSRDRIKARESETGSIPMHIRIPGSTFWAARFQLLALQGSIGDINADQPLSVGTNIGTLLSGNIEAAAGDSVRSARPGGRSGKSSNFVIGPVEAGHNAITAGDVIRITADNALTIDGIVDAAGPIDILAGGLTTLTPNADVNTTTQKVTVKVGTLLMEDANRMQSVATTPEDIACANRYAAGVPPESAWIPARSKSEINGTPGAGATMRVPGVDDALITGIETGNATTSAISVVSRIRRILDNGDTRLDIIADTPPGARLTISAPLGIGADPLDVRLLNLRATSTGGVVDLAVQDSVGYRCRDGGDRDADHRRWRHHQWQFGDEHRRRHRNGPQQPGSRRHSFVLDRKASILRRFQRAGRQPLGAGCGVS